MIEYVCTVPRVPPSLNEWRHWHWAKQDRERLAFQSDLSAVLTEKGNRCPRGLARVELHAVIGSPVKRRRDRDNFGAVLYKWAQDVLVQDGIIPDDDADRCASFPVGFALGEAQTILILKGWTE